MLISFWKGLRNLFLHGLLVISFCLMSVKNEDFFNLLIQTLSSEGWTEKAPHCLIASVRKITKEAQGHTVQIQQEQLTSKGGVTSFVALFSGRSLWARLCKVPAGQSEGAESRALSACCAAACLPPSHSSPACWGRGFQTGPLQPDSSSSARELAQQLTQEQEGSWGAWGVCLLPRPPLSSARESVSRGAGALQK